MTIFRTVLISGYTRGNFFARQRIFQGQFTLISRTKGRKSMEMSRNISKTHDYLMMF